MKHVVSFGGANLRNALHELSVMEARHRALEDRLKELRGRIHLTQVEQREAIEIKKHKLRCKDELAMLRKLTG